MFPSDDEKKARSRHSRSSRRSTENKGFEKHAERSTRGSESDPSTDAPDRASGATSVSPSLAAFRETGGKRLKIHALETALFWVIGAHLVFLPWAIGSVHLWQQIVSLVLSTISLTLALWPRNYTAEHTGDASFRLYPFSRLIRFPMFWLGLALLLLITVQGFNPAWEYQTNGKLWWMRRVAHIDWLPTGVRVPFNPIHGLAQGGEWRILIVYGSAWMTVCAIWIGLTRRRTLQRLLILLVASGVILSLVGIAERVFGAPKIFWIFSSPNPSFFASFIYKNHAGAYLVLVLAIAAGLGAWYFRRAARRLEKSSPAGMFAFFICCLAVSVVVSSARGATLVMLAYLCVIVVGFLYYQWRLPAAARNPIIMVAMLLVFGLFLKTGLDALNSDVAWDRLREALSGRDVSVEARATANRASLDMLGENWKMGVGAGGFPFLFTAYQQHYPQIAVRQFWPHAHNDILELPIDLGVAGVVLIAASFLYWLIALGRASAHKNPLTASVILGCLFLVGMSWGDFVFFCPAVLLTWCALWPVCTRWAQLEEQRGRG